MLSLSDLSFSSQAALSGVAERYVALVCDAVEETTQHQISSQNSINNNSNNNCSSKSGGDTCSSASALLSHCSFETFKHNRNRNQAEPSTSAASAVCSLLQATLSSVAPSMPHCGGGSGGGYGSGGSRSRSARIDALLVGFRRRSEVLSALSLIITCTHRCLSNLLLTHTFKPPPSSIVRSNIPPVPTAQSTPSSINAAIVDDVDNDDDQDIMKLLFCPPPTAISSATTPQQISPQRSLSTTLTTANFETCCEQQLEVSNLPKLFNEARCESHSSREDAFRSLLTAANDVLMLESILSLIQSMEVVASPSPSTSSRPLPNLFANTFSDMSLASESDCHSVFRFLRLAECDPTYGAEMLLSPAPVTWTMAFAPIIDHRRSSASGTSKSKVSSSATTTSSSTKDKYASADTTTFHAVSRLRQTVQESIATSISFLCSSQVGVNVATFQAFSPWALSYVQSWLLEEVANPPPSEPTTTTNSSAITMTMTQSLTAAVGVLRQATLVVSRLLSGQLSVVDGSTLAGSLLSAVTSQPYLLLLEGGLSHLSHEQRREMASVSRQYLGGEEDHNINNGERSTSSSSSLPASALIAKHIEREGDIYLSRCLKSRLPSCVSDANASKSVFDNEDDDDGVVAESSSSTTAWMPLPISPQRAASNPFANPIHVTITSQLLSHFQNCINAYIQLSTSSSGKGLGNTLKGLVRTKQRLSASISESDGVRLQLLRALDFISHVNSTPYSPIHMTALGETLKQLASVSKGSIEIKWLLCKIIVACMSHVAGHRGFACVTDSTHQLFEGLYTSYLREWSSKERYIPFVLPCASIVITLLGRHGFIVESPKLFSSLVRATAEAGRLSAFSSTAAQLSLLGGGGGDSGDMEGIYSSAATLFTTGSNPISHTITNFDSIQADLKATPDKALELSRPVLIDSMAHILGFYLKYLLHPLPANHRHNQERNLLENNLKTMLSQVKDGLVQALRRGTSFFAQSSTAPIPRVCMGGGVEPSYSSSPSTTTTSSKIAPSLHRSTIAAFTRFLLVICTHRPVQYGIPLLLDILPSDPSTTPSECTLSSGTALSVIMDVMFNPGTHYDPTTTPQQQQPISTFMTSVFTLRNYIFHRLPSTIPWGVLVSGSQQLQASTISLERSPFYCIVAYKGSYRLRMPYEGPGSFSSLFSWEESFVALNRYQNCLPFSRPSSQHHQQSPSTATTTSEVDPLAACEQPFLSTPLSLATSHCTLSEVCIHTQHWWAVEQGSHSSRKQVAMQLDKLRVEGKEQQNGCTVVSQLLPEGTLSGTVGPNQATLASFAPTTPLPFTEICMMVLSGLSFSAFVAETTALNIMGALSEVSSSTLAGLSSNFSARGSASTRTTPDHSLLVTSLLHKQVQPSDNDTSSSPRHTAIPVQSPLPSSVALNDVVNAVTAYLDTTVVCRLVSSICSGSPINEQYIRQTLYDVLGPSCTICTISLLATTPPPVPSFVSLHSRITACLFAMATYLEKETVSQDMTTTSNPHHTFLSPLITPLEVNSQEPSSFPVTAASPRGNGGGSRCAFTLKGKLRFVDRHSKKSNNGGGGKIQSFKDLGEAISEHAAPSTYTFSPRDLLLHTMLISTTTTISLLNPPMLLMSPSETDTLSNLFTKPPLHISQPSPMGREEEINSNNGSFSLTQEQLEAMELGGTTGSNHSQEHFTSGSAVAASGPTARGSVVIEDTATACFQNQPVNARSSVPPLLIRMCFHRSSHIRNTASEVLLHRLLTHNDYTTSSPSSSLQQESYITSTQEQQQHHPFFASSCSSERTARLVAQCVDVAKELRTSLTAAIADAQREASMATSNIGKTSPSASYSSLLISPSTTTEKDLSQNIDDLSGRWCSRWSSPLERVRFHVRGPYYYTPTMQLPASSKASERALVAIVPTAFQQPQWLWSHYTDNLAAWVVTKICDYALWLQYNGTVGVLSDSAAPSTPTSTTTGKSPVVPADPSTNNDPSSTTTATPANQNFDETLRSQPSLAQSKSAQVSWPPVVETTPNAALRNTITLVELCIGAIKQDTTTGMVMADNNDQQHFVFPASQFLSQVYTPSSLAQICQEFSSADEDANTTMDFTSISLDIPPVVHDSMMMYHPTSARGGHTRMASHGPYPSSARGSSSSGGIHPLRIFSTVGWWGSESSMKLQGTAADTTCMNVLLRGNSPLIGSVLPSCQNRPGGAGGWVSGSLIDVVDSVGIVLLSHGDSSVRSCAFNLIEGSASLRTLAATCDEYLRSFLDDAVLEHETVSQAQEIIRKHMDHISDLKHKLSKIKMNAYVAGTPHVAIDTGRPMMLSNKEAFGGGGVTPPPQSSNTTPSGSDQDDIDDDDDVLDGREDTEQHIPSPLSKKAVVGPTSPTSLSSVGLSLGIPKLNLRTVHPTPSQMDTAKVFTASGAGARGSLGAAGAERRDVVASICCAMFDARTALLSAASSRSTENTEESTFDTENDDIASLTLLDALGQFGWAAIERAGGMMAMSAGAGCIWGPTQSSMEPPVKNSLAALTKLKRIGTTTFGDPIQPDSVDMNLLQHVSTLPTPTTDGTDAPCTGTHQHQHQICPVEMFREAILCTAHPVTVLVSLLTLSLPSLSPLLPSMLSKACFLASTPTSAAALLPSNSPTSYTTNRWISWWCRQRQGGVEYPPLLFTNRTTTYGPPVVESKITPQQLANSVMLLDKSSMDTWRSHFMLSTCVVAPVDCTGLKLERILQQSRASVDWVIRARILCATITPRQFPYTSQPAKTNSNATFNIGHASRPFTQQQQPTTNTSSYPPLSAREPHTSHPNNSLLPPPAAVVDSAVLLHPAQINYNFKKTSHQQHVGGGGGSGDISTVGGANILSDTLLISLPNLLRRFHDLQDIFEAVVFLFDGLLATIFTESHNDCRQDAMRLHPQLGVQVIESVTRICAAVDLQTSLKKDQRKALTITVLSLSVMKLSASLICSPPAAVHLRLRSPPAPVSQLTRVIDAVRDELRQAVSALQSLTSSTGGNYDLIMSSRIGTGRAFLSSRLSTTNLPPHLATTLPSFRARVSTARGMLSPTRANGGHHLTSSSRNVDNRSAGDQTSIRARLSVDSSSSPTATPREPLGSSRAVRGSENSAKASAIPSTGGGGTIHLQLVKLLDQFDSFFVSMVSDPEAKMSKKQGQSRKLDRNCGCLPSSLLPPLPALPSTVHAGASISWGTAHPDLGLGWEGKMSVQGRAFIIDIIGILSECGLGASGRQLARSKKPRVATATSSAASAACSTVLRERLPEFIDFLSHYVVWMMKVSAFQGMSSIIHFSSTQHSVSSSTRHKRNPLTSFSSPSYLCRLASHSLCSALSLYYYQGALRHMKKSSWSTFTQEYSSSISQIHHAHQAIQQALNQRHHHHHGPVLQQHHSSSSAAGLLQNYYSSWTQRSSRDTVQIDEDGSGVGDRQHHRNSPTAAGPIHRYYLPPQLSSVSLAALQSDPFLKEGTSVLILVLDNLIDCFGDAFTSSVTARTAKQRVGQGKQQTPLQSLTWGPIVATLEGSTLWHDVDEFITTMVNVAPSFTYLLFAKLSSSVPQQLLKDFGDHVTTATASASSAGPSTPAGPSTAAATAAAEKSLQKGNSGTKIVFPPPQEKRNKEDDMASTLHFASPSRSLMFASVVRSVLSCPVILLGGPRDSNYLTGNWKQQQSVPIWPSTQPGKVFTTSPMMVPLTLYALYFVASSGSVINLINSALTTTTASDSGVGSPMEDGYVQCAEFLNIAREFLAFCVSLRGTDLSPQQVVRKVCTASNGSPSHEVSLWLSELYATFMTHHSPDPPSSTEPSEFPPHKPQTHFFHQLWVVSVRLLLPDHDFSVDSLANPPAATHQHQQGHGTFATLTMPLHAAEAILAILSPLPQFVTGLGTCTYFRQCIAISKLFDNGAASAGPSGERKLLVRQLWSSITHNQCGKEEVTTHITITGPTSQQRPLVKRVKLLATPREQHCVLLLTGTSAFIAPHPHSSHPPTEQRSEPLRSSNIYLAEQETAYALRIYNTLGDPQTSSLNNNGGLSNNNKPRLDRETVHQLSESASSEFMQWKGEDSSGPVSRRSSQQSSPECGRFGRSSSINFGKPSQLLPKGRHANHHPHRPFDAQATLPDTPEFQYIWNYSFPTAPLTSTATRGGGGGNRPHHPSEQEVLLSGSKEATLVPAALRYIRTNIDSSSSTSGGRRTSSPQPAVASTSPSQQHHSFLFDLFKFSVLILRCRSKAAQASPFLTQAGALSMDADPNQISLLPPLHRAWIIATTTTTTSSAETVASPLAQHVSLSVAQFYSDVLSTSSISDGTVSPLRQSRSLLDALPCLLSLTSAGTMRDGLAGRHVHYSPLHTSLLGSEPKHYAETCVALLDPSLLRRISHALVCVTPAATSTQQALTSIINSEVNLEWGSTHFFAAHAVRLFNILAQKPQSSSPTPTSTAPSCVSKPTPDASQPRSLIYEHQLSNAVHRASHILIENHIEKVGEELVRGRARITTSSGANVPTSSDQTETNDLHDTRSESALTISTSGTFRHWSGTPQSTTMVPAPLEMHTPPAAQSNHIRTWELNESGTMKRQSTLSKRTAVVLQLPAVDDDDMVLVESLGGGTPPSVICGIAGENWGVGVKGAASARTTTVTDGHHHLADDEDDLSISEPINQSHDDALLTSEDFLVIAVETLEALQLELYGFASTAIYKDYTNSLEPSSITSDIIQFTTDMGPQSMCLRNLPSKLLVSALLKILQETDYSGCTSQGQYNTPPSSGGEAHPALMNGGDVSPPLAVYDSSSDYGSAPHGKDVSIMSSQSFIDHGRHKTATAANDNHIAPATGGNGGIPALPSHDDDNHHHHTQQQHHPSFGGGNSSNYDHMEKCAVLHLLELHLDRVVTTTSTPSSPCADHPLTILALRQYKSQSHPNVSQVLEMLFEGQPQMELSKWASNASIWLRCSLQSSLCCILEGIYDCHAPPTQIRRSQSTLETALKIHSTEILWLIDSMLMSNNTHNNSQPPAHHPLLEPLLTTFLQDVVSLLSLHILQLAGPTKNNEKGDASASIILLTLRHLLEPLLLASPDRSSIIISALHHHHGTGNVDASCLHQLSWILWNVSFNSSQWYYPSTVQITANSFQRRLQKRFNVGRPSSSTSTQHQQQNCYVPLSLAASSSKKLQQRPTADLWEQLKAFSSVLSPTTWALIRLIVSGSSSSLQGANTLYRHGGELDTIETLVLSPWVMDEEDKKKNTNYWLQSIGNASSHYELQFGEGDTTIQTIAHLCIDPLIVVAMLPKGVPETRRSRAISALYGLVMSGEGGGPTTAVTNNNNNSTTTTEASTSCLSEAVKIRRQSIIIALQSASLTWFPSTSPMNVILSKIKVLLKEELMETPQHVVRGWQEHVSRTVQVWQLLRLLPSNLLSMESNSSLGIEVLRGNWMLDVLNIQYNIESESSTNSPPHAPSHKELQEFETTEKFVGLRNTIGRDMMVSTSLVRVEVIDTGFEDYPF